MKFKVRYLIEHEIVVSGLSAQAMTEEVQRAYGCKVLGVIPFDQEWPDEESTNPRPPRNTPPSGSPGTPSLPEATALLSVIAA